MPSIDHRNSFETPLTIKSRTTLHERYRQRFKIKIKDIKKLSNERSLLRARGRGREREKEKIASSLRHYLRYLYVYILAFCHRDEGSRGIRDHVLLDMSTYGEKSQG